MFILIGNWYSICIHLTPFWCNIKCKVVQVAKCNSRINYYPHFKFISLTNVYTIILLIIQSTINHSVDSKSCFAISIVKNARHAFKIKIIKSRTKLLSKHIEIKLKKMHPSLPTGTLEPRFCSSTLLTDKAAILTGYSYILWVTMYMDMPKILLRYLSGYFLQKEYGVFWTGMKKPLHRMKSFRWSYDAKNVKTILYDNHLITQDYWMQPNAKVANPEKG